MHQTVCHFSKSTGNTQCHPSRRRYQKGVANPGNADAPTDSRSARTAPADSEAESGERSGQQLATEFTLRVTSFSADKLDKGLFQIPTGYKESHLGLREMWIAGIG